MSFDAKVLKSNESNCYIYKDMIYKIFNSDIDIKKRLHAIEIFLNNNIQGCPMVYDFIHDNSKVVGYSMKYYDKAKPFSIDRRFRIRKEICYQLVNIYLNLKEKYNICYFDFHNGNIFLNDGKVLLLDVDSCLNNTRINAEISEKFLFEYVLTVIYKTFFFDNELYFSNNERYLVRSTLYEHDGKKMQNIEELKDFIQEVSKRDVHKVLKKIPYKIR